MIRAGPYEFDDDSYIKRIVRITMDEKPRVSMNPYYKNYD